MVMISFDRLVRSHLTDHRNQPRHVPVVPDLLEAADFFPNALRRHSLLADAAGSVGELLLTDAFDGDSGS